MPKEFEFEPMPKRQQNIYIIQGSNDDDKDAMNYIKSLITQLRCEAQCHLDVAFNVYLTVYLNTNIWGQSNRFTLEPENVTIYPTLPSVCRHEMSVWDNLSETISSTIKNDHSKGLTSYLPIFIFLLTRMIALLLQNMGHMHFRTIHTSVALYQLTAALYSATIASGMIFSKLTLTELHIRRI